MKLHLPLPVIIASALLAINCNHTPIAKPAPHLQVEDFFKEPRSIRWRISPDGNYISFIAPYKGHNNIFVRKIEDSNAILVTNDTTRNIQGYQWKGDHILYLQDVGGDENWQLFSATVDGKTVKPLTAFLKVRTNIIDDLAGIPGKEKEIIISLNKRDPQYFDPYSVNIETGELKLLYQNNQNFDNWWTDHNGIIRLASNTDGVSITYFYRASEKDPFDSLLTTNYTETFSPQLFTFDNKNLYAISNIGRDKTVAVEYDLSAKKEIKILYDNPDYDLDEIQFSHFRKLLTNIKYNSWKMENKFLDYRTSEIYKRIKLQFPNYEVNMLNNDDIESKYIVSIYSDKLEGKYYLYNRENRTTTYLDAISPWLHEDDMAEMKPIEYMSRDSLKIHGYLTLPKGIPAKDLPVVINPHGGPWARDVWGFNSETQLLANRGYAVLQMNFRASTGYGKEFFKKGNKAWDKIQNDIADGTQWLISQGIADPKRIAIYGASFGGFSTLYGVTFTPDLYACGVDYVGPSNFFSFYKSFPTVWKPYLDMWHEMLGDPVRDSAFLAGISPLLHSEKIKVPLFIAQGANDPRVNKNESDQMVAALRKRGVDVQYMVKMDEGHGFYNTQNQLDFYRAMDTFFTKHLASVK